MLSFDKKGKIYMRHEKNGFNDLLKLWLQYMDIWFKNKCSDRLDKFLELSSI